MQPEGAERPLLNSKEHTTSLIEWWQTNDTPEISTSNFSVYSSASDLSSAKHSVSYGGMEFMRLSLKCHLLLESCIHDIFIYSSCKLFR